LAQAYKERLDRKMWLEFLVTVLIVVFGACCYWYFFDAKTEQPLTKEEVELMWKLHKKQTECTGSRKDFLMNKDGIVGFRCECGYQFKQERLITQEARKLDTSVECSESFDLIETETVGE
jgi:hypothetical protein